MIESATLNSILSVTAFLIFVIVCLVRRTRAVDNYPTALNADSIAPLLERNGFSSLVEGPWIIFNHLGQEYTINTSKMPFLFIIKQTSLDGFLRYSNVFQDVAQTVSLDTAMVTIHLDGSPANRVIFQVNAVENCITSFIERLHIYLELLDETEALYFEEVRRKGIDNTIEV